MQGKKLTLQDKGGCEEEKIQENEINQFLKEKGEKIIGSLQDESWSKTDVQPGTSIYTRVLDSNIVQAVVDCTLDLNIMNTSALIYEADLYHRFVPLCKQSSQTALITKLSKIAHFHFSIPILSDRQAFIYASAVDLSTESKIGLVGQNVTNNVFYQKIAGKELSLAKGRVELKVELIFATIQKAEKGYRFKTASRLDTQLPIVPHFLIKMLCGLIGKFVCNKLLQMTQNLEGTPWQTLLKDDKNLFYAWFEKKIGEL